MDGEAWSKLSVPPYTKYELGVGIAAAMSKQARL
jgi:hypothetical protein